MIIRITPNDLVPWRDPDELLRALGSIAREQKEELRNAVAGLLDHEDPDVREEALRRLIVQWKAVELRPATIQVFELDEDPGVRSTAAYGLAVLSDEATRRQDTELLLSALLDENEDAEVRRAAYEALMLIHDRSDMPPMNRDINLAEHVDWTWIRALAAPAKN